MQWLVEAGPFAAVDGDGRHLFNDAEVRLREATAVALDGPSGAGKTTLLRQLTGLTACREAGRKLAGEEFPTGRLPAWRARVTLLAQDAPMVPGTVADNLELPFRLRAARGAELDRERARHLLDRLGLANIPLERPVATLSGGERHRLAMARGLIWDPAVLVADEPLSGVDPETTGRCFELLLEFAHRPGHALLVVVHDRRLSELADRRWRLSGGRLEAGG